MKSLWLGIVLLVLAVAAAVAGWYWRRQRAELTLGRVSQLRALPRFQQLIRDHTRRGLAGFVALTTALLGCAWLLARPGWVTSDSKQWSGRDVILCVDVSGSMSEVDAYVVESLQVLAKNLTEERIGFVAFDSAAATYFPLTNDYEFVENALADALTSFRNKERTPVWEATQVGGRGSSLIGDGLASCVQRFDKVDEDRPRTIVLATDNKLAGTPIFSLSEANRLAAKIHANIFAVAPFGTGNVEKRELEAEFGKDNVMVLEPKARAVPQRIAKQIRRSQAKHILALPGARSFDQPAIGLGAAVVGVFALVALRRRDD
ncbi:VWA domain-containing protein [Cutibacterium equinum]|uniref:VWA domain-containing protein n=1 Tax=Cutibacterium equinum TaxID=3016342 RepID=A0ABY7QZ69_9ACTN|nr:VWA domain-containing protein [Cutibacterium equinum]WCC79849.1 VWA domain-containing protein [Cutibacterium equinum]